MRFQKICRGKRDKIRFLPSVEMTKRVAAMTKSVWNDKDSGQNDKDIV